MSTPSPEAEKRHPLTPLPWSPTIKNQARGVLLLLLGLFFTLKYRHNAIVPRSNLDGEFYTHLAMNIRDGLGLVTDISLYHKGFSYFPHETSVYPLWPMLYGYLSRLGDITWMGRWLPTLFYFLTLILAYILANRIFKKPLLPQIWPVFNAGHLAVIMLGTARNFFVHTSLPYTEGLSFFLLMVFLLRAHRRLSTPSLVGGLELGLWCGIMMMARSQLFLATLALGGGLAVAMAFVDLKKYGKMLAAMALGFGLGILPWVLYLQTFIPDLSFNHLLRFDDYRENDLLSKMIVLKKTNGLWAFVVDRAQGIPKAFYGYGKFSYFSNFNVFYFAFLVALPLAIYESIAALVTGKWRQAWAWLRTPQSVFPVVGMLFAIGGLVSLHLIHKVEFTEWNFALRHALTAIFIFYICIIYISRRPVLPQLYAILLIVVGTYNSIGVMGKFGPKHAKAAEREAADRSALIDYLEEAQEADPNLVVAGAEVRRLAMALPDVGFHWTYRKTSIQDIRTLTDELGTDLVLVRHEDPSERFMNPVFRFDRQFEKVAENLNGFDVYRRK